MTQFTTPSPIDNPQTLYELTKNLHQPSTNLPMNAHPHLSSMSNLLKNSRQSHLLSPNTATTSYTLSLEEDQLPEEITETLNQSSFVEASKAFDLWFTNLTQFEQCTVFCLLFNRLDSGQYPFIQSVINKQCENGQWLKNQLPNYNHANRESRSIEVDALSKLMEALSTDANQLQPIRSNRSIYRNSQPVPIDFTRLKARFDPFPENFLENENSELNTSFPNSQTTKLNSSALSPGLLGHVDTLPVSPIARTRPKSMFEPGMGAVGWKSEQSSPRINGHSRLAVPNAAASSGVDSVTWAVPISPNYAQYPSNTMPSSSRPIGFSRSDDPITRSHLGLSSPTVDYGNTNGYQTYQTTPPALGSAGQSPMTSRFKPSPNNNNRNNRRSYDYSSSKENASDFFTQGYRHVLGKMPSSIKNHLIKPSNRVDFDLLQDIPAWLRSLRLHKYTKQFDGMVWQDVIQLTDEGLTQRGVAALGARRKMLKHFELIKQELNSKQMQMQFMMDHGLEVTEADDEDEDEDDQFDEDSQSEEDFASVSDESENSETEPETNGPEVIQFKDISSTKNFQTGKSRFLSKNINKMDTEAASGSSKRTKRDLDEDADDKKHDMELDQLLNATGMIKQFVGSQLVGKDKRRFQVGQLKELGMKSGKNSVVPKNVRMRVRSDMFRKAEDEVDKAKETGMYHKSIRGQFKINQLKAQKSKGSGGGLKVSIGKERGGMLHLSKRDIETTNGPTKKPRTTKGGPAFKPNTKFKGGKAKPSKMDRIFTKFNH